MCTHVTRIVTPNDFYLLGAGIQAELVASENEADGEFVDFPKDATESAKIVDVKPRRGAEETEEAAVEGGMPTADLTPRSNHRQQVMQRPELDMHVFNTNTPVLCWDTETAGLGRPAICQLAYVLVSADGSHHTYDKIWKLPEGVYMSKEATKIHGITSARAKQGAEPVTEMLEFWKVVQKVLEDGGVVLGHNIQFDCRAFNFTAEQFGITNILKNGHMLDTMKESKCHSTLTTAKGHQKPFKNDELCKNYTRTNTE